MTPNERIKKLFDLTNKYNGKLEQYKERSIVKVYREALKNIRNEISQVFEKFGDTVTYSELHKYNRLTELEKRIEKILKEMGGTVKREIRTGLKDYFQANYYQAGYAVESSTSVKLGFGQLNTDVINAALYNPYDRIKWDKRFANNIVSLNQHIRETLATGLIQGEGYAKIASNVKKELGKSTYETQRIFRTEGHRVQQAARVNALDKVKRAGEKVGLKTNKVWLATLDERTREDHRAMDGRVADEDGIFHMPDGTTTEAPGMTGVARHDINCRCDVITEIEEMPYKMRKDTEGAEFDYISYKDWAKSKDIPYTDYNELVKQYRES